MMRKAVLSESNSWGVVAAVVVVSVFGAGACGDSGPSAMDAGWTCRQSGLGVNSRCECFKETRASGQWCHSLYSCCMLSNDDDDRPFNCTCVPQEYIDKVGTTCARYVMDYGRHLQLTTVQLSACPPAP